MEKNFKEVIKLDSCQLSEQQSRISMEFEEELEMRAMEELDEQSALMVEGAVEITLRKLPENPTAQIGKFTKLFNKIIKLYFNECKKAEQLKNAVQDFNTQFLAAYDAIVKQADKAEVYN